MLGDAGDAPGSTSDGGARPRARRRRLPRWLIVTAAVVLLVAAAAGGWLWNHSRTALAAGVTPITYTVQPTTLQRTVTTTGTFAPAQQDDLTFPASGTVTAVRVKVGQRVSKGQVLATQDTGALAASVTSAQASVDAARSQLSTLRSSSSTTSTQVSAAEALVASDQAKLSQARQNLAGATMTSPIAGTVAQVNLTVGTSVSGASSTTGSGGASGSGGSGSLAGGSSGGGSSAVGSGIVVVDTSSWLVDATVGAADLPSLKSGLQATMNLSASTSGTTGAGQARFGGFGGFGGGLGGLGGLGGRADPANSSGGAAQRGGSASTSATAQQLVFGTVQSVSQIASSSTGTAAFPVTITVTGSPTGIYIGSTASVSILVEQLSDVLAVPTLAISETGGRPSVEVQTTGGTEQRAVTLGPVFGQQTQVTAGLSAGDVVVVGTRPAFATNRTGGSGVRFGTRASAPASSGGR